MTLLRSALLTGAAVAFCGISAAQLVPGGEPPPEVPVTTPAAVPAPPPPPPPPAASSSGAGMVTSMSFDELKAIFEAAGVPYELKAFDNGQPYLAAAPEGFQLFASVLDCADTAKMTGCTALGLESGRWARKTTLEELNVFNSAYFAGKAFLTAEGEPGIIYSFGFGPGVSPTYVKFELKAFVSTMKYFGSMEWLPKTTEAATPPATGSFSVTVGGRPEVLTGGAPAKSELPQTGGAPIER